MSGTFYTSIKVAWHIFNGFFKQLFPPYAIFVPLSFFKRKYFRNRQVIYFILIALTVMFTVRFFYFLFGVISIRYLLPTIPLLIILCVPGFYFSCLFVKRFVIFQLLRKYLLTVVLIAICISAIIKTLHFRDSKPYIKTVGSTINRELKCKATFITDFDPRPAYYAGSDIAVLYQDGISFFKALNICRHEAARGRQVFFFFSSQIKRFPTKELESLAVFNTRNGKYELFTYRQAKSK